MKQKFTLLRNVGLSFVGLALGLSLNAQNLVVGGDMASEAVDNWTIGWRANVDLATVDFGVEENAPSDAESLFAADIMFGTSWNETQLWQVVELQGGTTYNLSAMLNIEVPEANTWVQGFLMPWADPDMIEEHAWSDDAIGLAVQLLQTHGWDDASVETFSVDGEFPKNIEENSKFLIGESVTPEATGDWVVLFKMGGNQSEATHAYLTDVVVSYDATSVNVLDNAKIKVYPTNAENYIYVAGISQLANINVYSLTGSFVMSETVSNNQRIDVSSLSTGMYFIQVTEGENRSSFKFNKQ